MNHKIQKQILHNGLIGFEELSSLLYKLHDTENLPETRLDPDPINRKLISRCPLELTDYVIV